MFESVVSNAAVSMGYRPSTTGGAACSAVLASTEDLAEISRHVEPDFHAVVPENVILTLGAGHAPELNPVEDTWWFTRDNRLLSSELPNR